MMPYEYILFSLLIKHWVCDFAWQTPRMLNEKGVYGATGGLQHAFLHALCTFVILAFFDFDYAVELALLDGIVHYHIDWIKMKFGTREMKTTLFWKQFGLDQLAHQITYLLIVGISVRLINL